MKILISASSTHGSTTAIAVSIADELRSHGLDVELEAPDYVRTVEPYDAVVIGSAVYFGRWMEGARDLVTRHADELRAKPVWLFSSGPLGQRRDAADGEEGERHKAELGARQHRVFDGSLSRADVGLGERLVVALAGARYGDDRDFGLIRAWARTIALDLQSEAAPI